MTVLGGRAIPPTPDRPPNVVLVLIDALRPAHLGVYGYLTETAPFLHELAQEATVFRRAYSTRSRTAPSR